MCGFIEIRAKFVPKNSNVLKHTNLNIYQCLEAATES